MAAARQVRRQKTVCDNSLLMSTYNFNFEVTCQVKVRSKFNLQQYGLRDVVLGIFRDKNGQECTKYIT